MNQKRPPFEYNGRSLGNVILIGFQVLVGFIHILFGFWLLTAPWITSLDFAPLSSFFDIYSFYTIVFGFLTLLFAVLLWFNKRWGWIGAFSVLVFVTIVDSLTLLDLPSIPGIPKFACFGEITYSAILIFYLIQALVRIKYKIKF